MEQHGLVSLASKLATVLSTSVGCARGESGGGPSRAHLVGALTIFVSLGAVSCSITLLYLGMRSVMEIGGSCASGNVPYEIRQPCPGGVAGLMVGGIWGGLIFAGVYAWQAWSHHVPNLVPFFWSALFLSLGWNFLDFGLDPPGTGGVAPGWLVCAVIFFLMGGLPLIGILPLYLRHLRGTETPLAWHAGLPSPSTIRSAVSALRDVQTRLARTPATTPAPDMVSELERLDALHRSGALDDAEYEAAKRRILGTEAT